MLDNEACGADFTNDIREDYKLNAFNFLSFYQGGGVALADVDNDGLLDICLVHNRDGLKVYINKGNLQFEEATQRLGITTVKGWHTGLSVGDVNNDGWVDLYLSKAGTHHMPPQEKANMLYINKKGKRFVEAAEAYGVDDTLNTIHACFFDMNNDGWQELYQLNQPPSNQLYLTFQVEGKTKEDYNPGQDKLFINNKGTLTPAGNIGLLDESAFGLSITAGDLDHDGYTDLFVGNDFYTGDFIYKNMHGDSLQAATDEMLNKTCMFSMGSDVGDLNNDGFTDLVSVDMMQRSLYNYKVKWTIANYDQYVNVSEQYGGLQFPMNVVQLNRGNGTFTESAHALDMSATNWSWSPLIADLDLNGHNDLLITNGMKVDFMDMDYFFFEAGKDLGVGMQQVHNAFEELSADSATLTSYLSILEKGPKSHNTNFVFANYGNLDFRVSTEDWGMAIPSFGSGAAYGDLDNDGDLEVVVNNVDEPLHIWKNTTLPDEKLHYLKVALKGYPKAEIPVGAKVYVHNNEEVRYRELQFNHGFQSSTYQPLHFGLGAIARLDSVVVLWPNGKRDVVKNVKSSQTLTVTYRGAGAVAAEAKAIEPYFNDAGKVVGNVHVENPYQDFKLEPLLPKMYSRGGPAVAVADVNGDGRQDIFWGASKGLEGILYVQDEDGNFEETEGQPWRLDDELEDMGALFFDADNDGDEDLYIVSGGNEYYALQSRYRDRLYLNKGDGNFKVSFDRLPEVTSSGSVVTAADYDNDGDLDLFVGGRVSSGAFAFHPRSMLLQNDKGYFTDVTEKMAPGLDSVGMVTSALWTDYDNDGDRDLIVAGEWMPLKVYENKKGKLSDVSSELIKDPASGWWNSLTAGDFNNDGYTDYVVGNLGLNTRYHASKEEPLTLYTNYFDANNTADAVISMYDEGKEQPLFKMKRMQGQMTFLKREYQRLHDFASQDMVSLFGEDKVNAAQKNHINNLNSVMLINQQGKGFKVVPLPPQMQLTPLYGMLTQDINNDGKLDLIAVGNSKEYDIATGYLMSGIGFVMLGDGDGGGEVLTAAESGMYVPEEARSLAWVVKADGQPLMQIGLNNKTEKELLPAKAFEQGRALLANNDDDYALIYYKDGTVRKQEFHKGEGYLTQSAQFVWINGIIRKVEMFNFSGDKRVIKP